MTCYAYYRLPYADSYTAIETERKPLIFSRLEDVGCSAGFVIAPFRVTAECPMVMIWPDEVNEREFGATKVGANTMEDTATPEVSDAYRQVFSVFHSAVSKGEFHKLVLARTKELKTTQIDYRTMYEEACRLYPRLMIMMFSTPQTGTWIIASPEILVEGRAGAFHTVALAGTMAYRDGYLDWSEKNKAEQHIVEQYIADTLQPLCDEVLKDGPVTMRAGDLVHLRTDFRFHLKTDLGTLVSKLHPTPAVCGLPKSKAYDFILANEPFDRRYYSGFAGPVGINDETHLYVSLRCAELAPYTPHRLYAGGGIMPESQCEAEWQETESKMKTIAHVLNVRRLYST